ncbi:leucine-rich repeat domain-containing protein [Porphyromonas asaccharolytica]
MSKQLRIWLFVLLSTLFTSTSLPAEGVITMTTSQEVGESLSIGIEANGNVSIEGVKESARTDGAQHFYTLTNQTIVIRGDVTMLSCESDRYRYGRYNPLSEYNRLTSLNVSECVSLTKLNCSDNQLTSLNVSGCTALTELNCSGNQLTSLNVSGCTALTELNCSGNQLTSLNVSGCTALKQLSCYKNQLTNLDVSGCTALTKLDCSDNRLTSLNVSGCTALTKLDCSSNWQTSLDVSGCTALTTLTCYYNQLTSLDVSGCTALTSLGCSSNPLTSINLSNCASLKEFTWKEKSLISLNVSGCTSLTELNCYYNRLTSLNISGCTSLIDLSCSNNQLTSLDVSGCTALTELYCSDNQLASLDVSKNPALTKLYCSRNQLTSLDVSGCTTLTKLYCYENKLTSLDVLGCTALTEVRCFSNQLTSLNMSGCDTLTALYCDHNQLTDLDISGCNSLRVLFCDHNPLISINLSNCTLLEEFTWNGRKLTSLDASGCTSLTKLDCEGNPLISINLSNCTLLKEFACNGGKLTSLDASGCTSLTKLDCYKNKLPSLDVSGCTALTELDCSGNQLTKLDLSGCAALTTLSCSGNQLTKLDLLGCAALTTLSCSGNQLTKLDLSGCAALTTLSCSGNQLTNLNLSGCTALTKLDCYKNRLKGKVVTQMVTDLPDWVGKEPGSLYVFCDESDENNLLRSDVLTASRKNWRVFKYIVNTGKSVPYSGAGDDEIVMTITKEQYLEGGIRLAILADGDVTIEGVHEKRIFTDGSKHTYTLAGTQVTIRGDISKLDCSENQITNLDLSKCNSLWTLDCSGNKLTNVDVSGCSLLSYLDCSNNQINGENMTRLVTNLPSRTGLRSGNLVVISRSESEGNLCRPSEVAIAQEKNWISKWEDGDLCKGIGEGVITMTTSRSVGDSFELRIVAEEDVVIEGIREKLIGGIGRLYKVYTLTSQTVTVRGHVTSLDCSNRDLTSLNVSGCTSLTELDCHKNQLPSLDVSGCTALTKLDCSDNRLTSLNVSGCTALTELYCGSNRLTSLNASGCTSLTKLDCSDNRLTSLDVSGCTALTELDCWSNQLASLDLSGCPTLTRLNCSVNQINGEGMTKLLNSLPDRKGMSSGTLQVVEYSSEKKDQNWCSFADVATASEKNWTVQKYERSDWKNYPGIGEGIITMTTSKAVGRTVELKIEANGEVVIEGVSEMPRLGRDSNNYTLTSQTITIRGDVTELDCSYYISFYDKSDYNQLTSLNASGCSALTSLNCSKNQLASLDLSGCTALTKLNCYSNQLTSLDVSGCTALTKLDCRYNQLTSLNASGCTALTELDCSNNQLSSLDLSQDSALTKLDCSKNQLSSLDLSQNSTLTELDCSRNKLETLNLSACTRLESLACYRNKIRGNAVAQLVESLPDRYGKKPGKFYFVYYSNDEYEENFCYRPAVGRASDKNWRPQKLSSGWEDYFGVIDEGVVTMHTAQEVGSKITLTLEAKGDVAIDGVKGVPETDGKPHQYTLLSQDVTIRGYVTKLHCSGNKLTSLDLSTTVPLVELDCSNNQLVALDVSQNAAVTSLACYRNQIKGEAMTLLIKGLPQLPLRSTHLFGIVSNAADEGNVFLKADVERVRDKGWSPMKWDEKRQQYEPYAGKETETFAVTLTKEGEGTISATGADDLTAVPYGTELTIVATPTEGYELISLTAGEEDILATKKVVVTDNVTVKATFDEATFAVTLTSNEHGDITIVEPVDLKAVPYGTTLTVKATGKNAQCVLTELTANGKDILATKSFVVTGVTEVKATFVDHTGVETTVTQQVKLYPNPATDYVLVEGVAAASEVTLHSMTGERLYAGRADGRGVLQIDLTPYADGVYLVCVAGETYRVVVRH